MTCRLFGSGVWLRVAGGGLWNPGVGICGVRVEVRKSISRRIDQRNALLGEL